MERCFICVFRLNKYLFVINFDIINSLETENGFDHRWSLTSACTGVWFIVPSIRWTASVLDPLHHFSVSHWMVDSYFGQILYQNTGNFVASRNRAPETPSNHWVNVHDLNFECENEMMAGPLVTHHTLVQFSSWSTSGSTTGFVCPQSSASENSSTTPSIILIQHRKYSAALGLRFSSDKSLIEGWVGGRHFSAFCCSISS